MWYLEDMIKYASWFKLTDFQAHISEDTFNDYSAFRLESDIPHLTSTDGYYTKDEYRDFQKHAQNYGIRVITEIDGPAHARRFIELGNYEDSPEKYKNLGLDGTHFNLSNDSGARDRVLGLMDEILEEFLGGDDPVIITDAFNIGMDEYFGNQDDLRAYAVHMYDQVVNKYHKTAFAWDSNASLANASYPAESYPMDDIVINFWKWEEVSGGMKALMDQGYKVVNGDHRWYIVPGAQIGFYDYANEEKLYNEVSAGNMVGWYGNGTIFPEGHPSIVGGNMLIWNDRGMFAGYTVNDIFARQRSQYPYLSQAYWYGHEENETFSEFKEKVNTVGVGPGLDNLYKDIDSQGEVVYNFDMESLENNVVKDNSGNNYDATVVNGQLTNGKDGKQLTFNGDGYIETQHKALKWPYTAVFDLTIDTDQTGDITLFEEIMPEQECVKKDGNETGQEKSVIVLKEQEDGTYRLTYSREGFDYEHDFTFEKGLVYRIAFSSDESKPTGGEYAKWNQPNTLYVNGTLVSTLQGPAKPDDFTGGSWWVDSPSINMPLEKIGQNLVGSIDNFQLYNRLLTSEEIADLGGFDSTPVKKNLALNKPIEVSSSKNDSLVASNANDGDQATRWASNYNSSTNDPFDKEEWLCIDLKDSYDLGTVNLYWEDANAQEYTIQVSEDGDTFTDVLNVTDGDGETDVLDLAGAKGRYIRIYCTLAVPSDDDWKWNYGYSLFEVEVYEGEEPTAKADKSELESLIKEADAQELKDYTDASVDNFNEALANAKKVMENDTLTEADQQIVDDAVKALKDAISALKYKDADYTKVDAGIAEANALNKDQYTNYSAVDAAVKAVVRGKNITEQDSVDAMAKAIEDAIAALTYKDADYTKVDEAIEKANALNKDDYKDFSAVDAAIQAVVRGKNITEQDAVDAMAKAIEDAIAALEEVETPVVLPYEDVNESDWFYNYVYDVYVKKLMTGLEETVFGPGNDLVRAQFAVIIYRMEGEPEVIFKDTFADVKDGNFYSDAVIWAAENGIVTGYTATGLFGPNDKITREQMAAIMFRYAKYKQLDTAERENLDDFTDGEKVQPFAIDAMEWCVAKAIISGKGEDDAKYLDPQTGASRAECATIISRYTDMK